MSRGSPYRRVTPCLVEQEGRGGYLSDVGLADIRHVETKNAIISNPKAKTNRCARFSALRVSS